MESVYYIKNDYDINTCFYYEKDIGIVFKTYEKNKWSDREIIFRNSKANFTLTVLNGKIYIFSQDIKGDLYATNNINGVWRSRVLIENNESTTYRVAFYPIITRELITLIYNKSIEGFQNSNLTIQNINEQNIWSKPIYVDRIYNMNNDIFSFLQTDVNQYIIFYIKNKNNFNIGYRIITNNIIGDFNSLYQTTHKIINQSFIYFDTEIHCIFIIKSLFSYKLIYTNNKNNTPITLHDGENISDCIISKINNEIIVHYIDDNNLYKIKTSENKIYSKEKLAFKNVYKLKKANFTQTINENNLLTNEIYVNKNSPWEAEIFPKTINNFVPKLTNFEKDMFEYEKERNSNMREIERLKKIIQKKENNLYQLTQIVESKNTLLDKLSMELLENKDIEKRL